MHIKSMQCVNVGLHPDEEWLLIWSGEKMYCLFERTYEPELYGYTDYVPRSYSRFVRAWFYYLPEINDHVKFVMETCPLAPHLGLDGTITERSVRIISGLRQFDKKGLIWREGNIWQCKTDDTLCSSFSRLDVQCRLVAHEYGVKVIRTNNHQDAKDGI